MIVIKMLKMRRVLCLKYFVALTNIYNVYTYVP